MIPGKLFVLSAPSGTGKTTILKKVMSQLSGLQFSVSHTTRDPRDGEEDGVDYHFVSKKYFEKLITEESFLEYANVHGNYYGTSYGAINDQLNSGLDVILDIDVQGARLVMNNSQTDASFVFIMPPSLELLEKRLRSRATDSDETIELRMTNAVEEIKYASTYDYLVVNDVLEDAVSMLSAVIIAERSRMRRDMMGKSLKHI
ncbi:MAG: guanylate kinase [Desulfotalea sp.]